MKKKQVYIIYLLPFGLTSGTIGDFLWEMMSASVEIHRRHLLDALKKPISCADSFNYKILQYQPLETPVSNDIN